VSDDSTLETQTFIFYQLLFVIQVREGSAEWKAFAERNDLDIRLYDHILHLFDQQKEIIDSYAKSMAVEEE